MGCTVLLARACAHAGHAGTPLRRRTCVPARARAAGVALCKASQRVDRPAVAKRVVARAVAGATSAVITLADDVAHAACDAAQPSASACPQAVAELAALDPHVASLVAGGLGPLLSVGTLLFIVRRAPYGAGLRGARREPRSQRACPCLTPACTLQDCDDVVSEHQGRRVPLDSRLRAHRAAAGANAQDHHACRVRARVAHLLCSTQH